MQGLSFCEMHGIQCKYAKELEHYKNKVAELELQLSHAEDRGNLHKHQSQEMENLHKRQSQEAEEKYQRLSAAYWELAMNTRYGGGGASSRQGQDQTDYDGDWDEDEKDGPVNPARSTATYELQRIVVTREKTDRCTCEASRAVKKQASCESLRFQLQVEENMQRSISSEQLEVVSVSSRRLSESARLEEVQLTSSLKVRTVESQYKTLQDFRTAGLQPRRSKSSEI